MAGRDNLSVELDQVTVSDLLAGELPKPFILRYLQRLDEIRSAQGLALLTGTQKKRIYEELLRNVPENMRDQGRRDACSRSVFFRADYTGKCARVTHQRTALLRSIGRSLSSAYVEAIVIDR